VSADRLRDAAALLREHDWLEEARHTGAVGAPAARCGVSANYERGWADGMASRYVRSTNQPLKGGLTHGT
jgi:hypothetical protein